MIERLERFIGDNNNNNRKAGEKDSKGMVVDNKKVRGTEGDKNELKLL